MYASLCFAPPPFREGGLMCVRRRVPYFSFFYARSIPLPSFRRFGMRNRDLGELIAEWRVKHY